MAAADANLSGDITQCLLRWRDGDKQALDRLTHLVYSQLRRQAASLLQRERPGHTLQPTALVHELYLRLGTHPNIDWQCRGQFFAVAGRVMRRILVDHARKRCADKRAMGESITLGDEAFSVPGAGLIEVDAALCRLAKDHPRQAQVVELRFFGGLTSEEIAEALRTSGEDVSLRTVERDWRFSRAWLKDEIGIE
jgi:RNA polymerase sigma factor (TIGR02999 family)